MAALLVLGLLAAACGASDDDGAPAATQVATSEQAAEIDELALHRDPNVPALPFADNPDPNQCGIPTQWGPDGQAWLTGVWAGDLIQPDVLLYDSHQRFEITGHGRHGAEVNIVLYQQNPVLDYYLVEVAGDRGERGWVPAPFISFEPVA
ncbi:MAG: hypothetical protein GY929_05030 [Actinomycetia bacterium]|nr:hypothetical protein [Actinomycetes bacterium]